MKSILYVRILAALVIYAHAWIAFAAGPVQEDYPGAAIALKKNGVAQGSTSGQYGASQTFAVGAKTFEIDVDPLHPANRSNPANGTDVKFDTVLAGAFANWTFNYFTPGNNDLTLADNTLVVRSYGVKTPSPAGMDFYVKYVGSIGVFAENLHWIQVIDTNWDLPNALYTTDNEVDNGGAAVPYYDDKGTAAGSLGAPDKRFFWDTPSRDPADLAAYNGTPLYWRAELYLVNETSADNGKGGRVVDIYDGVRWGWTVTAIPEPANYAMLLAGLGLIGLAARRRKQTAA